MSHRVPFSQLKINSEEIQNLNPQLFRSHRSTKKTAVGVCSADAPMTGTLGFLGDKKYVSGFLSETPAIVICTEELANQLQSTSADLLVTKNLKLSMSLVLSHFESKIFRQKKWLEPKDYVSQFPNAQIHPSAMIEVGVTVGSGAIVGPYCHLQSGCSVGENTELISHVFLGSDCFIGQRCLVSPFVSIGTEGFGFVRDSKKQLHRIPQVGQVIIEDDVRIGSFCSIDRATLGVTKIGQGVKMDDHCHIAHNCSIGNDSALTAGFIVAGSTHIGKRCEFGGQVGVNGHIQICDDVILGGRSAVVSDIESPGAYVGHPLESYKDGLRTLNSLKHLTQMRKQLKSVLKKLGIEDTND